MSQPKLIRIALVLITGGRDGELIPTELMSSELTNLPIDVMNDRGSDALLTPLATIKCTLGRKSIQ
jgi:hypothetical protein